MNKIYFIESYEKKAFSWGALVKPSNKSSEMFFVFFNVDFECLHREILKNDSFFTLKLSWPAIYQFCYGISFFINDHLPHSFFRKHRCCKTFS